MKNLTNTYNLIRGQTEIIVLVEKHQLKVINLGLMVDSI